MNKELTNQLINLRALSAHQYQGIQRALAEGSMTALSRDRVIPTEVFRALAEHDRAFIRAFTVGVAARKALLTGFSGARMHGMWVVGRNRDPVELGLKSIPPRRQWNPGTVYRHLDLPAGEVLEQSGVRTPRPFRIFAEIARHHGFQDALVAADWLQTRGITTQEMRQRAELLGRRYKGIGVVRQAIEHCIPNSDSPFEPYFRAMAIEAGLPVRGQVQLTDDIRVDNLVGDHTVVEIDGEVKYRGAYGKPENVIINERKREKIIQNLGNSVLRYSPAGYMLSGNNCHPCHLSVSDARSPARIRAKVICQNRRKPTLPQTNLDQYFSSYSEHMCHKCRYLPESTYRTGLPG